MKQLPTFSIYYEVAERATSNNIPRLIDQILFRRFLKRAITMILFGLLIASCKKEENEYYDLRNEVMFIAQMNGAGSYMYKYYMTGTLQKRIINGQVEYYRTPGSVYSNKWFQLYTYYKTPIGPEDSVGIYP